MNAELHREMRVNFGCGLRYMPGFVNVDKRVEVRPDVVDDIRNPLRFVPDSIDLIYACHVLEHFKRNEVLGILFRWRQLLKPGGTLRLSVPDFDAIVTHYNKHGDLPILKNMLYGAQYHSFDYHYNIWNHKTLGQALIESGYFSVRKWDWRKTDHSHIDDLSQAYLPHLDKENGLLMSLNLEASR